MNELERRLAEPAPDYPFPATPDIGAAVLPRLSARPHRDRRLLVAAIAVAAAALTAVLAFSSGARSAVLDGSTPFTAETWSGSRSLHAAAFFRRSISADRYRSPPPVARLGLWSGCRRSSGDWRLSARLGGRRFFLGALRVVASNAEYRLFEPGQVLATPSRALLAAERGTRNQVVVVDPATGRVSLFARGLPQPYGLAFSPDRFVFVSTVDGVFRIPPHGGRRFGSQTASSGRSCRTRRTRSCTAAAPRWGSSTSRCGGGAR